MKVIVFGSTGGTGRAAIAALLAAGHAVTAFARDAATLADMRTVRTVQGDAMIAADVAAAVSGQDAVVVSLGNSQNPFAMLLGARRTTPLDVCEVGTRNIVAAMTETSIKRLVVVTAFGIGRARELPFAFKVFYLTVLREHMADKEKQELLVKASTLDWTLVQPVGLTDAKPTGDWLADTSGRIRRQQVSRADVAAFIVSLLERGDCLRARDHGALVTGAKPRVSLRFRRADRDSG
jgi:uncharacterized protein YbjT (DUF2867 family)